MGNPLVYSVDSIQWWTYVAMSAFARHGLWHLENGAFCYAPEEPRYERRASTTQMRKAANRA